MDDKLFNQTIELFKKFNQVDAIVLGGSRVSDNCDTDSDYDVFIYLNNDLCVKDRKKAFAQTCKQMKLDIWHWGVNWDDCKLNNGIPMEFTYDKIENTKQKLRMTLEAHITGGGFTTCTCYLVFNSVILYDPAGLYADMKKQFTMPYPEQLKEKIISVNRELLEGIEISCVERIITAIKRNDVISINHRIAEFIRYYYDILFALNKVFHPGEKRLIEYGIQLCKYLPANYEKDLYALFSANTNDDKLTIIRRLLSNLDELIKKPR